MKSGLILLLLAALLVAMPVAADIAKVSNGGFIAMDSPMFGTKIIEQEEVTGILPGEMVAACAVEVSIRATGVLNTKIGERLSAVYYSIEGSYAPTPGAGGDGLFARFT